MPPSKRRPPSAHKIVDLLDEDHRRFSPLQRLLKTSANQKTWTAQLHALLEPSLHNQVEITNVRGPNLHILCRNAAVATRVRFLMADILPQLRQLQSFQGVREVKIHVSGHKESGHKESGHREPGHIRGDHT